MASVCHFLPYRGRMAAPTSRSRDPRSPTSPRPPGSRPRRCRGPSPGPSGSTTAPASTCCAVAEELGYVPNPTAQALESGRTSTIALLVPDITNPYFSGVIKGAERAAAAAGLTLVLGRHRGEPDRRGRAGTPPRACRGRVRDQRLPAHRRRAARGRRAQPDRPGQPGHGRARLRGRRLRLRHPADRRPPRVVRPPVVRLRRRSGRVVVGRPSLAGLQAAAAERGMEATPLRSLHAHARWRPGRRRRRGRRRAPPRSSATTTCSPSA